MNSNRKKLTTAVAVGLSASILAACSGGGSADSTVAIVGFAVPEAGNNGVIEAFNETDAGDGVQFTTSYGPSGDQSRSVADGQAADFVHFSIEPDVTRLVDTELVADDWNSGENAGFLTTSVAVLVVRAGNPKDITTWEDLVRDDVSIVTPNPGSSGAARWNILGAWQSYVESTGSEEGAEEYIGQFLENVASFPASGRNATTTFLDGTGDVLISYENEAILAKQGGEDFEYIVPDNTLLIENPAAVTVDASESAQEFLDFALTAEGQAVYASFGFRPLEFVADEVEIGTVEGANDPSAPFPEIETLYTIEGTFGGWEEVVDKFFDDDGIITNLIAESGLTS